MKRAKIIIVLAGILALLTSVGVAMATTGATTGYPQPKVVVPANVSAPYEQRYVLTAVGSGAPPRSTRTVRAAPRWAASKAPAARAN